MSSTEVDIRDFLSEESLRADRFRPKRSAGPVPDANGFRSTWRGLCCAVTGASDGLGVYIANALAAEKVQLQLKLHLGTFVKEET